MHLPYPLQRTAGFALFIVFLLIASQYAKAEEPAGRLMFVHGQVWIERNGQGVAASRGDVIFAGDTIITEAASSAQIRFTDGGTNALRPNTRLILHEYLNDAENPKNSRKTTELARGGLRSISGAISRAAPENVSYNTPVATMGIRGTTFVIVHNEQGTHLRVEFGAVSMQSQAGIRIARPGQAFRVGLRNQPPVQIPPDSDVFEEEEPQRQGGAAGTGGTTTTAQAGVGSATPPASAGLNNNAGQSADGLSNRGAGQQPGATDNPVSPDTPEVRDNVTAEQACQAQGFVSCMARDAFFAAERVCQAEGFASCAAKDSHLAAEQACQALGFDTCAARDAYLAAEQVCQAQGFANCAARDNNLVAEQVCQAQGFPSCAERDAFLAAEQACQVQGFPTCAERDIHLALQQVREANCGDLGFSSCNQMLSGSQYVSSPLTNSGGTQVMIGGNTYLLPNNQAQWLTHAGTAVLGGFNNPTQVRVQTLNNATPVSGGSLTATIAGGTSYYWGVWSKNDVKLLNPSTLALLGATPGDLHYVAASQMFTGNVMNTLEDMAYMAMFPLTFVPTGGTALNAMSTSSGELIRVDDSMDLVGQSMTYISYDSYDSEFNVVITLFYPDSAAEYFVLRAYDVSPAELLATNGYTFDELVDAPTFEPAGNGTLKLNFTGGAEIDGAISQLRVNFDTGVQAYGNLIWQIEQPPMPVSCDGFTCRGFTSLESEVGTMFYRFYEDGGATFVHTGGWQVTGSELQPATVISNAMNNPVADVYWGYWAYGGYDVRDVMYQPYDLSGGFHYIFSEDSFNGSVDISSATPIVFNLLQNSPLSSVAPGSLSLTDGSLTLLNSEITAQLTFLNEFNTETLTGALNGLPSLASLPMITLTPTSAGQISSATIEGFFVGPNAEGIASWITVDRDGDPFKGTAVFQRQ